MSSAPLAYQALPIRCGMAITHFLHSLPNFCYAQARSDHLGFFTFFTGVVCRQASHYPQALCPRVTQVPGGWPRRGQLDPTEVNP